MLLKRVRYSLPYLIQSHAEIFDKPTTNLEDIDSDTTLAIHRIGNLSECFSIH